MAYAILFSFLFLYSILYTSDYSTVRFFYSILLKHEYTNLRIKIKI